MWPFLCSGRTARLCAPAQTTLPPSMAVVCLLREENGCVVVALMTLKSHKLLEALNKKAFD
ncbi:MAG: hypothetical protein ACJA0I_000749 [Gammaproteobacteria bacterium]|jgi:hypothetical protein